MNKLMLNTIALDGSNVIVKKKGGGGGSGAVSLSEKDVNFYDYDGILLHSYSKDEFLQMSSLPELPTRAGLICQEWNYNLSKAKEYVEEYGVLDVGATYITDDGKTRLYITIAADGRKDVPLNICLIPTGFKPGEPGSIVPDAAMISGGRLITDWGDGNIEEIAGCNYYQLRHRYQEIGNYVISIATNEGYELLFGSYEATLVGMTSEQRGVMFNVATGGSIDGLYASMLKSVEIGNNVTRISVTSFYSCQSLTSIVIPNSVTIIGRNAFNNCKSLSFVVIPNSVTSIRDYAFNNCQSLASIVIPNGVTYIGSSIFNNCQSLSFVVIPNSVTSTNGSMFYSCKSLSFVVIPNSVTSISDYAFYSCQSLASIVIPNSVTSIGTAAFYSCQSLASIVIPNSVTSIKYDALNLPAVKYYDFSHHTSIPTLHSSMVFGNPSDNWYILIPSHLYDTWINEPNWSSYADRIITDKSIIDNDDQSGEHTQAPEE